MLELPKCAYTKDHLDEIARVISSVHAIREEITGLKLTNEPHYVDEAEFETHRNRLFVPMDTDGKDEFGHFEKYKIAIFEPLKTTDKDYRKGLIEEAGYNPGLLQSDDVYLDFYSDSGTSAMSGYQWEGMLNSADTPFNNRHYLKFLEEFKEILGYNYVIPTHQGRAAEHIMSQTLIKPGQIVPGNMYFTTTKLHQEMAGGIFEDIIVDEAHDPGSTYPWKGNIDIRKLERLINEKGAENIAYISYELSVNMAGGQPVSMQNVRDVSKLCQKHNILVMFDATRCVENACMIKMKDPDYAHSTVKDIVREILSYGDGCTISCKKDFLVNMGGVLACNSLDYNKKFQRMLRIWEGDITNGGLDAKDLEALNRGLFDALDDDYIEMRIEQTQELSNRLNELGIPIVNPPGLARHAPANGRQSFPYSPGNAQVIATKNGTQIIIGIAQIHQRVNDIFQLLRSYTAGRFSFNPFLGREQVRKFLDVACNFGVIKYEVQADSHVLTTDKLHNIIQVANKGFGTVVVLTEKHTNAVYADHAARIRARANQVVTNVAAMLPDAQRIRMGKNDGLLSKVKYV
jgi:tyrosine phenol-lyase